MHKIPTLFYIKLKSTRENNLSLVGFLSENLKNMKSQTSVSIIPHDISC